MKSLSALALGAALTLGAFGTISTPAYAQQINVRPVAVVESSTGLKPSDWLDFMGARQRELTARLSTRWKTTRRKEVTTQAGLPAQVAVQKRIPAPHKGGDLNRRTNP